MSRAFFRGPVSRSVSLRLCFLNFEQDHSMISLSKANPLCGGKSGAIDRFLHFC
ncbi:hypothetical protein HMPREF1986_01857 [Oribacterium sp. oral taxon 078 str. F0263]|nr:hypothetical protein HMPREF1986_01857 [Oribacterium sp. oral taxon 078 str. F0263]